MKGLLGIAAAETEIPGKSPQALLKQNPGKFGGLLLFSPMGDSVPRPQHFSVHYVKFP